MVITTVVKVQMPMFHSGAGPPRYLVASEDKSISCEVEIGIDSHLDGVILEEIHETRMPKVYFNATLEDGIVSLWEIVRLQECAKW